jgi:mannose-1-phosphate guanylyltransferase/mannose-1-phosphate guanylyltransferase/phosphomannomutase
MVLAAGLGTRLRPLTYEIPQPMVPVLDRPVMGHILDLLERHDIHEVVANLHYFPDCIRGYFGDELTYRFEPELLGTAGGVRNCADFLGPDAFLIISGDALTDIDLDAFAARHRQAGGIATLAVKRVADTREYGVVVHDAEGRVSGFQEKPDPAEALSDLGNCGIYMFNPEIFDYFPDRDFVDWAQDVFPTLLEHDVPFFIHELEEYWNDIGSLDELRRGTWDAMTGALRTDIEGQEIDEGRVVGEGSTLDGAALVVPPVWIGHDVRLGPDARLHGPLAIGDGAVVGQGANLRDSIIFPGTEVAKEAILIGAIAGHAGIVDSLRPRRASLRPRQD